MLKHVLLCLLTFSFCQGLEVLEAPKAYAPNVPPPITRTQPALLRLRLNASVVRGKLNYTHDFEFWTYDDHVPGPLIRARAGDQLEVTFTNTANSDVAHNIDFHAVSGTGGGAPILSAKPGHTVTATFQLLYPGLYVYHCAVEPAPHHVANGLYGLILVEPSQGLPKVDREFYIMKSEFYTQPSNSTLLKASIGDALDEKPSHVVFNGRVGSLVDNPLNIKTNERIRVYFGNAGPNQVASFHIIGTIFDKVYREGDLITPPGRGIQTTSVPAGGSAVVEFSTPVPGTYTIVDHSLFRILKGAVGYIKAEGVPRLEVYCPKLSENATCGEYVEVNPFANDPIQNSAIRSYDFCLSFLMLVFTQVVLGFLLIK